MPRSKKIPIKVFSSSGEDSPGLLFVEIWNKKERYQRAIKLILRILKWVLVPCGLAIFVHPFILPVLITVTTSPIWLTALFFYFSSQDVTFLHAQAKCPYCLEKGNLNHYLWTTLSEEITLLCPKCGQTCKGWVKTSEIS